MIGLLLLLVCAIPFLSLAALLHKPFRTWIFGPFRQWTGIGQKRRPRP